MDAVRELYERQPQLRFSVHTAIQATVIVELGSEIRQLLDSGMAADQVDGSMINSVYGKFWLWVLGAYEVVRTMGQAKSCFTEEAAQRILAFKRRIATLRMPFAKQEFEGRGPIASEASVSGIDIPNRDLRFDVAGQTFGIRELLGGFESLIRELSLKDILTDRRTREHRAPAS